VFVIVLFSFLFIVMICRSNSIVTGSITQNRLIIKIPCVAQFRAKNRLQTDYCDFMDLMVLSVTKYITLLYICCKANNSIKIKK
jgi:hypothetical protein